MRLSRFVLAAVILLLAASCSRIRVEPPDGFAEYKTRGLWGPRVYRAVSPEGMLFKARSVRNYPSKDLDFWKEALFSHLEKEGYRPAGQAEVFQASGDGVLFEWAVPYGQEDYIYLTAIVPSRRRIVVVEAGAEYGIYREYREAILNSLKTISCR